MSEITLASSILIPQVLHYDQDEYVLVISDLGPLNTLSTVLAGLSTAVDPDLAGSQPLKFNRLGSRLGQFMGDLHSPDKVTLDRASSPSDVAAKRAVELEWAVKPIEGHLRTFHIQNATELYTRVIEDFQRTDSIDEQSFALGDLTPGAILLGNLSDEPTPLGVIDWEFSGRGRGIHGDIAQLLAQVHLHLIAHGPKEAPATSLIKAFLDGITSSYRTQRQKADKTWTPPIPLGRGPPLPPPATGALTRTIRSSFILHGREMINAAVDLDWPCECCDEGSQKEKEKCTLIRKMVDRGVWYLCTAGANEADFIRTDNWERSVLREENRVLIDMMWSDDDL